MTDEDLTPVDGPQARPSRGTGEVERRRRAALGKLVAAVLVALPGAYAAVRSQSAADVDVVRTEVRVRDAQEAVIQRHVEALRREIEALRKAAVTHRDLLDLVLKLREQERERPRTSAGRTAAAARGRELDGELETLRKRDAAAKRAKASSTKVQRALPAMKPAPVLRKAIQRGDPLGDLKL